MAEWLFFRDQGFDLRGFEPDELVGEIFFDLWKTRQPPYTGLEDGDTLYFLDRHDWRLIWEWRARKILKKRYHSITEALDLLRTGYGLLPDDLNDYIWTRPQEGYLLAWAAEIVAPMDVSLPDGIRPGDFGGRTGYLPLSALPPDALAAMPLPKPGRPAAAEVPAHLSPELISPDFHEPVPRHIPAAVRHVVRARDGGACRICQSTEPPLHFDHVYPWSKGGTNDPENLQLLCRKHNLEKAASVPAGLSPPRRPAAFEQFLSSLGLDRTSSAENVATRAVEQGRGEELYASLDADPSLELARLAELVRAARALGIDPAEAEAVRLAIDLMDIDGALALELVAPLADHPSDDVRNAAGFVRSFDPDLPYDEQLNLLRQASDLDDLWIAGPASLGLALEVLGDLDLEEQEVPAEVMNQLEKAAAASDLGTRADACMKLALLAGQDREAAQRWLRGALVSPDPEVVAEAAVWLSLDAATKVPEAAAGLASRALQSSDPFVVGRAHLVLAEILPDEAQKDFHLAAAMTSEDPEVREVAAGLAAEWTQGNGETA